MNCEDRKVSEAEIVEPRKRKSGIPTGNAGEYFVMGELLKRGYDAQLADRNTKGYDVLVGKETDKELRKCTNKNSPRATLVCYRQRL